MKNNVVNNSQLAHYTQSRGEVESGEKEESLTESQRKVHAEMVRV